MRNMTSLLLSLVAGGCLLFGALQPAAAHAPGPRHDIGHRHDNYTHRHHVRVYPYWLRTHADFHRWYGLHRHRYDTRLSWHRLYDLYRHDRHYHYKHPRKYKHRARHGHRRHH